MLWDLYLYDKKHCLLCTCLGYSLSQWSDQVMKRNRRTTEFESLDIHRSKSECRNKLKKDNGSDSYIAALWKREWSVAQCYYVTSASSIRYFQHRIRTLPKCGRHSCIFQHEAGHGAEEMRVHFHLNCKHHLWHHRLQTHESTKDELCAAHMHR